MSAAAVAWDTENEKLTKNSRPYGRPSSHVDVGVCVLWNKPIEPDYSSRTIDRSSHSSLSRAWLLRGEASHPAEPRRPPSLEYMRSSKMKSKLSESDESPGQLGAWLVVP
jgi:hypothetical protein